MIQTKIIYRNHHATYFCPKLIHNYRGVLPLRKQTTV